MAIRKFEGEDVVTLGDFNAKLGNKDFDGGQSGHMLEESEMKMVNSCTTGWKTTNSLLLTHFSSIGHATSQHGLE